MNASQAARRFGACACGRSSICSSDRFGAISPGSCRRPGVPSRTWAPAEADIVLCTETLEHVLEPLIFLRELRRILAPSGRLILTVPFAARWHFVPQDYWRFTPSGLAHLLTEAGFCEVRIYPRGGALAVAGYKTLGFILLLLAGSGRRGAAALLARFAGILALPAAALAAVAGHVGLAFPGSPEDTLGYTVLARAAPAPEAQGM
jgi:SAM-dependent methyltransferase